MIEAAIRRRGLLVLAGLLPGLAWAAGTEAGLAPRPGAALPLSIPLRDASGAALTLEQALDGIPAVFAFADYDCNTLCGTTIGLAAAMLPGTGLTPGRDYRLVVIGLDPADGPSKAAAMRRAWLGEENPLADSARFLVGDAAAVAAAEDALGYRAVRRGEVFDHPLALFVLRADGGLEAALPGLGAQPETVRDALVAASHGEPAGLFSQIVLLCQGIAGGKSSGMRDALAAGGALTVAGLGGFLFRLSRRERRP